MRRLALGLVLTLLVLGPSGSAVLYQLKRLAKESRHVQKLDRALRVIGDAELSEE